MICDRNVFSFCLYEIKNILFEVKQNRSVLLISAQVFG